MPSRQASRLLTLVVALILLGSPAADAGTISLEWDPVEHPDLAGYRLYYGPSGGPLAESTGVTASTAMILGGLASCTEYTVAVKAVDSQGVESAGYSNLVVGWARPAPTSATQATVERGSDVQLQLGGTNFQPGASVVFTSPEVTATGVTVNSCQQITLDVSVGPEAPLGPVTLRVVNPDGVFGEKTGLFSVVGDGTPPTISEVDANPVDATTATIGWETDEPSDSRVFYRMEGETAYQQTALSVDLVTVHSVELSGLAPDSTYEYHVTSADADGNTATSPDETFTTQASEFTYLRFEAEAASPGDPITGAAGESAFAGGWIELPEQAAAGSALNPSGVAEYGVYVPHSGSWRVWVRVSSSVAAGNTWYERIDGVPWSLLDSTETTESWTWVSGSTYELDTGLHAFGIGGQKPGSSADRVIVTDDLDFHPTEEPGDDASSPDPVAAGATSGNGSSFLNWTVPQDTDSLTLVIRYRTDDRFPISPVDGLPLVEMAVEPGSSGGTTHEGQVNGTTYSYAVFAVDLSGNASDPAEIEATPAADPPPTVTGLRRTDKQ